MGWYTSLPPTPPGPPIPEQALIGIISFMRHGITPTVSPLRCDGGTGLSCCLTGIVSMQITNMNMPYTHVYYQNLFPSLYPLINKRPGPPSLSSSKPTQPQPHPSRTAEHLDAHSGVPCTQYGRLTLKANPAWDPHSRCDMHVFCAPFLRPLSTQVPSRNPLEMCFSAILDPSFSLRYPGLKSGRLLDVICDFLAGCAATRPLIRPSHSQVYAISLLTHPISSLG